MELPHLLLRWTPIVGVARAGSVPFREIYDIYYMVILHAYRQSGVWRPGDTRAIRARNAFFLEYAMDV